MGKTVREDNRLVLRLKAAHRRVRRRNCLCGAIWVPKAVRKAIEGKVRRDFGVIFIRPADANDPRTYESVAI